MTKREELIWLAGLLEGEGSFTLRRYSTRGGAHDEVAVQLQMTDEDVVRRAAAIMDATVNKCSKRPLGKSHWLPLFNSALTGAKAMELMQRIKPFMGQRRKQRITELLSLTNLAHQHAQVRRQRKLEIQQKLPEFLETHTRDEAARAFNIHPSTVTRWLHA